MASMDPIPSDDAKEEVKMVDNVSKEVVETVTEEVLATAKTDIAAKVETVTKEVLVTARTNATMEEKVVTKDVLADARTDAATEEVKDDNTPVSVTGVSMADDKLRNIFYLS